MHKGKSTLHRRPRTVSELPTVSQHYSSESRDLHLEPSKSFYLRARSLPSPSSSHRVEDRWGRPVPGAVVLSCGCKRDGEGEGVAGMAVA